MEVSKEMVQEMKDLYKEERNEELSDDKAWEAAHNLMGYAELVYKVATREVQHKHRLKKEPNGFPVDGHYSCMVCGNGIDELTGWHSWYGNTCLICRKAITDGHIPTFVCADRDSYYSMWHIKDRFNIKHQAVKKLIKEGKLKARTVLNEDGTVHEYIFLKKENLQLLPHDPERHSPSRKSYDRNREKVNTRWSKEKAKEWKEEFFKKKR